MEVEGLVSVIIPTRNSASTVRSCIESVKNQTYSSIEMIVVDTDSTDGTIEICERNKVKVLQSSWKTLGSRLVGLQKSSGEYILQMDSDQILEKTCIQNCVNMIKDYDMLCLEEMSYNPRTLIQKMIEADRQLHYKQDPHLRLDPLHGPMTPRFYRRAILERVFYVIPKEILPFHFAKEDNIIFYEAYKLSTKVGVVRKAVWHQDPNSIRIVWHKNRIYGKDMRDLAKTGHYSYLLTLGSSLGNIYSRERKKRQLRKNKGLYKNKLLSLILRVLTSPAYALGFYLS